MCVVVGEVYVVVLVFFYCECDVCCVVVGVILFVDCEW